MKCWVELAVNGKYGSIHCKWPINEWDNVLAPAALALTTEKMAKLGETAERHLDPRPNKTTVEYEKFHHAHFGRCHRFV